MRIIGKIRKLAATVKARQRSLRGRKDVVAQVANMVGRRAATRLGWSKTPFLPSHLDVEPVNFCNYECDHCQVTHWDKPRSTLPLAKFQNLVERLPNLRHIKLQGMGEPLLNKGLCDMVTFAEGRGVQMEFTTNGSVYTDKIGDQLSALQNTEITFSIDGATAETFAKLRKGGELSKVTENIAEIVRRRGKNPYPRVNVWTVANKDNVAELVDIVRLGAKLGVNRVTLSPFVSDWGKGEGAVGARAREIHLDKDSQEMAAALDAAAKAAGELGLEFGVNETSYLSREKKCRWPWNASYIAANGDVVPCCIIADADIAKMGNIHETEFAEIWNNDKYQDLRARIARHDPPDYCRNCYKDLPPVPREPPADGKVRLNVLSQS